MAHQEYIISEKEIYKSIWYIDFIELYFFKNVYGFMSVSVENVLLASVDFLEKYNGPKK